MMYDEFFLKVYIKYSELFYWYFAKYSENWVAKMKRKSFKITVLIMKIKFLLVDAKYIRKLQLLIWGCLDLWQKLQNHRKCDHQSSVENGSLS